MSDACGRLCRLLLVWQTSVPTILLMLGDMWGVFTMFTMYDGAHNTVDAQRHMGGALPCLSGMGVDGAHNTIGKISAPTTLLWFCHAREVVGYCPAGVQGTVLDIVVDLIALPYFLRPFPGPHRAGVPGRLVPVGSDYASQRKAVSRGSVHPRSETRVGVVGGV